MRPCSRHFSAGCVLYEMLTGGRPFTGGTLIDVLHSVMHHEPPPLAGPPEIEAINAVLRQALAKDPADRWPSAGAMRAALEGALPAAGQASGLSGRAITRLIALPFRILRKDDETEFLAYSLPDAIANSLARFDSLVVRSSLVAARFEGQTDPVRIGTEAQVDAILTDSLLRTGAQLRVTCQLVGSPGGPFSGRTLRPHLCKDLFALQDALANRIVESLLPPLTERDRRRSRRDVPRSAIAFEYFLRANGISRSRGLGNMRLARDLYRQCLADDPEYAPAWAGLGRTLYFIYKFGEHPEETLESADAAFRRTFALNPDLAMAHNRYTPTECDIGRAADAMVRLLKRVRERRHDAELYAGLGQAGGPMPHNSLYVQISRCGSHSADSASHRLPSRRDARRHINIYLVQADGIRRQAAEQWRGGRLAPDRDCGCGHCGCRGIGGRPDAVRRLIGSCATRGSGCAVHRSQPAQEQLYERAARHGIVRCNDVVDLVLRGRIVRAERILKEAR